jgi:hypothetical protein
MDCGKWQRGSKSEGYEYNESYLGGNYVYVVV